MYVESHTKRQVYKNAKTHNVITAVCVLFLIKVFFIQYEVDT